MKEQEWISPTPAICWIRKLSIYQTKNEYIIIGSNNRMTKFKILKVDRNEQTSLKIIDSQKEYVFSEILEIMSKIPNNNFKTKKISAFGILGFVRFLEGYYMIIITKRRKIAKIGAHLIYKIMETTMFYIPNNINKNNQDEIRYLKMFQNVDLSSNFYFSYSYDITHTLQYNLTPCNYFNEDLLKKDILEKFNLNTHSTCVCDTNNSNEDNLEKKKQNFCFECNINKEYAIKTKPNFKFVWNEYLLESTNLHPDWLIYIIHGYVGQTVIKDFGKQFYLTLIARRSQKFAGTRFLKRGTNQDGDVANEVETEQIISETEVINFNTGKFSSYVHIRGSIPSHWSQDISKMVPKPQISIDIIDPFSVAAGKHFNQLLSRYGSPIYVLNLVKMKEKRPHEKLLTNEITNTISYLNQFLPPAFYLQYVGMDMARVNKSKDKNVLQNLSLIAYNSMKKTGIFKSFKTKSYSNFNLNKCTELGGYKLEDGRILQTGIVRVNCVDCLDRTNTAAYVLGKTALAFQLFSLGLISDPLNTENNSVFEKKICKKLEELYEEHGDTLALQYGGSQLVHRIKTYRKKSHLSSQSRDFMQTISRYYSNAFSDSDKQMAINLFLGAFKAYNTLNFNQNINLALNHSNQVTNSSNSNNLILSYNHIWDMTTDFYLHNLNTLKRHVFNSSRLYTKWWDEKTLFCLPRACNEVFKGVNGNILNMIRKKKSFDVELKEKKVENLIDETTDEYNEHYNCFEYTSFDTMHYFEQSRLSREKTPNSVSNNDFNPISALLSNFKNSILGSNKNLNELNNSKKLKSCSSSSSEEESFCHDYEKIQTLNNDSNDLLISFKFDKKLESVNQNIEMNKAPIDIRTKKKFSKNNINEKANLNSLKKNHYGLLYCDPNKTDLSIYNKYVTFGIISGEFKFYDKDYDQYDDNQNELTGIFEFYENKNLFKNKKTKKLNKRNLKNKNTQIKKLIKYNKNWVIQNRAQDIISLDDFSFESVEEFDELDEFKDKNLLEYEFVLEEFSKEDSKIIKNYLDDKVVSLKTSTKSNEKYQDYLNLKF